MKMNRIKVLFFATLRDQLGVKEIEINLPEGSSVSDLKLALIERYSILESRINSLVVAVNKEFAFDEDILPDQAEVALFPPVSGGDHIDQQSELTLLAIADANIEFDEILSSITLATTGAVCSFTGVVRGETSRGEGLRTEFLEYEAYKPMAEDKMRQIANEIRKKWSSIEGIIIIQRIGRLYPGNPTVYIACSAPHRDTGVFEATRYGIDRLKEIVPVWKKEVGPEDQVWVEGKYLPGMDDRTSK
jgi:molybdopterin synthase catalytic subunit